MYTINKNITTLTADGKKLITEASTAGLRPGEWPDFIGVLDDSHQGFLFEKDSCVVDGVNYLTRDGRFSLVVLND